MHLRPWLRLPIAVPIAVVVLSSFCQAAEASVGVGVQGDPVRLRSVAHAGGSYAFPPVYVVNTGDQTESISVRAEQLSRGPDLAVPTSWVHAGPSVQLQPGEAARIPLELVVPPAPSLGRT